MKQDYRDIVLRITQVPFLVPRIRSGQLLSILIISFFLTSCLTALSTDTELNVWKGEQWKIETEITLSAVDVQAYGSLINQSFNEHIAELTAEGIDAEWQQLKQSQAGEIIYQITLIGDGYQKLNDAAFSGRNALTVGESDEERLIYFRSRPGNDFLGMVLEEKFTIHGGKIISSNGTHVDNNTVTWVNPTTTMEAVFTEASRNTWWIYLIIGLLIVAAIWFGRKYFFNQPTSFSSSDPFATDLPSSSRFCPHCGTQIPNEARFCPKCGHSL